MQNLTDVMYYRLQGGWTDLFSMFLGSRSHLNMGDRSGKTESEGTESPG